jgi:hypothetical protein
MAVLGLALRDLFPAGTAARYPGGRNRTPDLAQLVREQDAHELETAMYVLARLRRWSWIAERAQDVAELDDILDGMESRSEYPRRAALDRAGRWLP